MPEVHQITYCFLLLEEYELNMNWFSFVKFHSAWGLLRVFSQLWDSSKGNIGQKYRVMNITSLIFHFLITKAISLGYKGLQEQPLHYNVSGTKLIGVLQEACRTVLKLQSPAEVMLHSRIGYIHCSLTDSLLENTTRNMCMATNATHPTHKWSVRYGSNYKQSAQRLQGKRSYLRPRSVLGVYDWKWWRASGSGYCCCIYEWHDISR